MLSLAPKPKKLHSSGFHLFSVSRVKIHVGTGVFSVAVLTLWNLFPEHVKSSNSIVFFRHYLKTHLFRFAYPSYTSQVTTAPDHLLMNFASYLDYEIAQHLY